MTQFEFLSVFISIVLAFGVSDILSSWGRQIRHRNQIRHYWLHTAWTGLLLFLMVQIWWAAWILRDRTGWTFFDYFLWIFPYLTVSLVAYVLTPSLRSGERDIKRHYFDQTGWIFSLAAVYVGSAMLFSIVVVGDPVVYSGNLIRLAGLTLMVLLANWRNERFHRAAVVLAYVLLITWVVIKRFTL
jgi:hypothetical protein